MKFNNIEITQDSIMKARQYYIDLALDCIGSAESGLWRIADVPGYVASLRKMIASLENGTSDSTVTFMQRAYYIQTGEDVALLP